MVDGQVHDDIRRPTSELFLHHRCLHVILLLSQARYTFCHTYRRWCILLRINSKAIRGRQHGWSHVHDDMRRPNSELMHRCLHVILLLSQARQFDIRASIFLQIIGGPILHCRSWYPLLLIPLMQPSNRFLHKSYKFDNDAYCCKPVYIILYSLHVLYYSQFLSSQLSLQRLP
jgi:hypothetical protein